MKKILLIAPLLYLLASSGLHAQNIVLNPSFEMSGPLCMSAPPSPDWLGSGIVNNWMGIDAVWSSPTVNTGNLRSNIAPCSLSQFISSVSPTPYGDQAINLNMDYQTFGYSADQRAVGNFTTGTVPAGCYQLSLYANGTSRNYCNNGNNQTILQVVLIQSGGALEHIAGEFTIPILDAWTNYAVAFNIGTLEDNIYDQVELRFKRLGGSVAYCAFAYIDNISIEPCSKQPCDASFNGELQTLSQRQSGLSFWSNSSSNIASETWTVYSGITVIYTGPNNISIVVSNGQSYTICHDVTTLDGQTCRECKTIDASGIGDVQFRLSENALNADKLWVSTTNGVCTIHKNSTISSSGSFVIYNSLGQVITKNADLHINNGENSWTVDMSGLAKGIYTLRLTSGSNTIETQKIVLGN